MRIDYAFFGASWCSSNWTDWTGYCAAVGITATQASGVVSVTTGLQIIGRVLSGTMADMIGPINVLMFFTFMMGLMCIVIWFFATNLGVMMVFAIFYGLFAGGEHEQHLTLGSY